MNGNTEIVSGFFICVGEPVSVPVSTLVSAPEEW